MKMKILIFLLGIIFVVPLPAQNMYASATAAEDMDVQPLTANVDVSTSHAVSPGKKSFGFEYFPLRRDVLYNYESNAGDTEAEVSEADSELVLTYNAGSITYEQQFFKGKDGIYLTRTETSAFLLFGSKVTYPEPVLRLPLPLEVGYTWEWEGLETAGSDTSKLTIKGEALGEEIIKTPAGDFNCLKITMRIESEMGSKNTITEWLAPGVGVVKFHADLEGSGITGFIQSLMGLDEITFDLIGYKAGEKI